MTKQLVNLLGVILLAGSSQVFPADEGSRVYLKHVLFAGIGSADSGGPDESDDTPWSLGYIQRAEYSNVYWGVDVAGEGTSFDNTSGKVDVADQGMSLNLLVGRNLNFGASGRAGVGVLLGARETGEECPDSYLGYDCYADQDPDTEYKINYGAMVHLTFQQLLVGVRATGESTQVMFGLVF